MSKPRQPDASVIVIGAGPVGMSAALFLADLGVDVLVVERQAEPSGHPKARGVRLRTMELFRQLGIEDELRSCALPAEARRFIYCDTLAGQEIARSPSVGIEESTFSPTTSVRVAQDSVERVLRSRVDRSSSIRIWRGQDVVAVRQDPEVAVLSLRNGRMVRAPYVIAADGVGSTVRQQLGVATSGQHLIAYWQSIYWLGDIDRWAAHRPCIQFMTGARNGRPATVASVDGHRRWVTMITAPTGGTVPEPLRAADAADVVRAAVGDPELKIEVLDVATWRLSATVADRWAVGRIFLAGDAAHSFPPTGGFGMNTGVQDVHNLAWKIAYVLSGRASEALLATYENERWPVAKSNAEWSVANSIRIMEINASIRSGDEVRLRELLDEQGEHLMALQQDLGYTYSETPGPLALTSTSRHEYVPTVVPGRRAPHMWVRVGGERVSTVDLFHRNFVLLCSPADEGWHRSAEQLGADAPPVTVVIAAPGGDIEPDSGFDELFRLSSAGPVLVRPDGHVAARLPCGAADTAALTSALFDACHSPRS